MKGLVHAVIATNSSTYPAKARFVQGDKHARYDFAADKADLGYPRDGANWAAEITGGLDAAFGDPDWHVTITIPGTTPFVETSWYAEVRYPAEAGDGNPDLVLKDDRIRSTWSEPGKRMEMSPASSSRWDS